MCGPDPEVISENMAHLADPESQWLLDNVPIDLGDDNHRAGWVVGPSGARDVLYLHRCKDGRRQLGRCDVTTGTFHTLVAKDPLHLEPSILCVECGDHGFIRDGVWVPA